MIKKIFYLGILTFLMIYILNNKLNVGTKKQTNNKRIPDAIIIG